MTMTLGALQATPLPDPVIVQAPWVPPWVTLPPEAIALIALGFLAACTIILAPLFRALARRIEGGTTGAALRGELDQMQARLSEVEALQHRIIDLEERLDFAERLLAQGREVNRLAGGA